MFRAHALSLRALLLAACVTASASTSSAGGIRVVDLPSLPPFVSMQAAVDAAPDGALLLIQTGNYGGAVIDNKSITLVAVPNVVPATQPKFTSTFTVRNLAAGKRVAFSGIDFRPNTGSAMVLQNDVGTVRFQNCKITGAEVYSSSWGSEGAPGIDAVGSTQLVFASCQIFGGDAQIYPGTIGYPGGAGLRSLDSNTVLYDCTVRGGRGGEEGSPGGDGGDAIHLTNWGLFASGCTITGGNAGGGDYIGCNYGGDGGDGLYVTNAQAKFLDTTLGGGSGGWHSCSGPYGAPGVPVSNNGGNVTQVAGTRRKLVVQPAVGPDLVSFSVTVTGVPGDGFYLMRSWGTAFSYQTAFHGTWTIPSNGQVIARRNIPAGNVLTIQVPASDIVGLDQRVEFLQGYCIDAVGQRWLTGPIQIAHLDVLGGPDCDGNNTNDFIQLVTGGADCNKNVSLDSCDISSGTSQDANGNGIPDECPGG